MNLSLAPGIQVNRRRAIVRKIVLTLLATASFIGCGGGQSGPKLYDVSGTVTFDGKPVPYGMIQFMPDTFKGNSGPMGFAPIENGEYSTKKGGQGAVGGPHQIVVNGTTAPAPAEGEVINPDLPVENTRMFPPHKQEEDLPKSETTLNIVVDQPAP